MANTNSMIQDSTKTFTAIMVLALVGLVVLIIFGNLSGNLGFDAGSQGENDTNAVISNITGGTTTFFSFAGVWFTLLAVALLVVIAFSLVNIVKGKGGNFSS